MIHFDFFIRYEFGKDKKNLICKLRRIREVSYFLPLWGKFPKEKA